jgi:hypothetical protein
MICPRREESGVIPGGPFKVPDGDSWRDDKTCSWCGGLDPVEALRLIESGAEITPTDKSYKLYVAGSGSPTGKTYFQHFSAEQQQKLIELVNAKTVKFAYPGRFYVLPFFMWRSA